MVSAELLLTQCICNSLTLLKLMTFIVLTTSGFFQLWPFQGYHFLTLFFDMPFLPRNELSSSNIYPGLDPLTSCSFLCPSCSLIWANSITLMLTAHTLCFSKMTLILNFAKVQNIHSVRPKQNQHFALHLPWRPQPSLTFPLSRQCHQATASQQSMIRNLSSLFMSLFGQI